MFLGACSEPALFEVEGDTIPAPLTQEIPDAERGKALYQSRGDAHCVLCHKHELADADFPGDLGPDLSRVSERLTAGQIRLRIADYDSFKPGTTMPSYYRTHDLHQLAPDKTGQTVLSALDIEDIIAFLMSSDDD